MRRQTDFTQLQRRIEVARDELVANRAGVAPEQQGERFARQAWLDRDNAPADLFDRFYRGSKEGQIAASGGDLRQQLRACVGVGATRAGTHDPCHSVRAEGIDLRLAAGPQQRRVRCTQPCQHFPIVDHRLLHGATCNRCPAGVNLRRA